jgi:hypothetical protein
VQKRNKQKQQPVKQAAQAARQRLQVSVRLGPVNRNQVATPTIGADADTSVRPVKLRMNAPPLLLLLLLQQCILLSLQFLPAGA